MCAVLHWFTSAKQISMMATSVPSPVQQSPTRTKVSDPPLHANAGPRPPSPAITHAQARLRRRTPCVLSLVVARADPDGTLQGIEAGATFHQKRHLVVVSIT